MKKLLLSIIFLSALNSLVAQTDKNVGINTSNPDPSAVLDVVDTTKGVLFPRMTTVQRNAIPAPATGLLVWQTDGVNGFYFYDGTMWVKLKEIDATSTVKGIVQLAGDLTGTAGSPTIANGAVTTVKLSDNAVTTIKMLDASVTAAKLANGAVTTAKIASGGNDRVLITDGTGNVLWITRTDLAGVADLSTIIGNGTTASPYRVNDLGIVTAKLADNAVTTVKVSNGAITTAKIASGGNDRVLVTDATGTVLWITRTDLAGVADLATIIGNGTTASPYRVNDLGIVTAKLANNAVTTVKITDAAVTTNKLASGGNSKVLVTDNIGTVVWMNRADFTGSADLSTILGDGTVANPYRVNDLGIVTAKLANNAVTGAKILDGAVDSADINSNAIRTTHINNGAVTNAKLANSTVGQTIGTLGTDVTYSAPTTALGGTTTLNIPNASATNRGALTSSDWTILTINKVLHYHLRMFGLVMHQTLPHQLV